MTTYTTEPNRHTPIMPLPMPSYAYRYPNSDSQPYTSLPDQVGIYNPSLPGTYKWETHYPETKRNLTYLGPLSPPGCFKEPPKRFATAPNWPRENYSPLANLNTPNNQIIAGKGYVPHFTNNTHRAWKQFLNETPERTELHKTIPSNNRGSSIVEFGTRSTEAVRTGTLDSSDTVKTGIGADFAQRPSMALSSQFRNNDSYRHSTLYNVNPWRPYGNSPAYFNTYITGAPKFS